MAGTTETTIEQKGQGEQESQEGQEEKLDEPREKSSIFSVEGVVMLSIGAMLDLASIICVILIVAFGVGLILAKIVYFIGLFTVLIWISTRRGPTEISSLKKKTSQTSSKLFDFLKRRWKKLAVKFIPAFGDAAPLWTWTIYSELKS